MNARGRRFLRFVVALVVVLVGSGLGSLPFVQALPFIALFAVIGTIVLLIADGDL